MFDYLSNDVDFHTKSTTKLCVHSTGAPTLLRSSIPTSSPKSFKCQGNTCTHNNKPCTKQESLELQYLLTPLQSTTLLTVIIIQYTCMDNKLSSLIHFSECIERILLGTLMTCPTPCHGLCSSPRYLRRSSSPGINLISSLVLGNVKNASLFLFNPISQRTTISPCVYSRRNKFS